MESVIAMRYPSKDVHLQRIRPSLSGPESLLLVGLLEAEIGNLTCPGWNDEAGTRHLHGDSLG